MKFSELRAVMLPESRLILRLYSSGSKIIDSGAVVLMNLGDTLKDSEVKLVYVAECIQHVDLLVSDELFESTNWEEYFGKEVYTSQTPEFDGNNYPDSGI